ncbi:hypothetical protein TNCV_2672001 [Trichonephila clavipes]|nr:hypothetical protein TNCV_2672001 [Trichonephila clavipes]
MSQRSCGRFRSLGGVGVVRLDEEAELSQWRNAVGSVTQSVISGICVTVFWGTESAEAEDQDGVHQT